MAVRIDLWVPTFTGTRHVTQYTLTNGSQHDIIAEQLPNLTSEIEQDLAEFTTGDVLLCARNDGGWWDSTAFTSATLDPTARFPLCLYIDIYISDALVFRGDVDIKTVAFDLKHKTVAFTCLGPLHRLEQWSAETVRRTVPTFCDFGLATSCGTAGSNWYLKDTTKTWYPRDVVNCCLIDSLNQVWTIIGTYGMGSGGGRDGLTITNPVRTPPNWGAAPTTPPPVGSYTIRPMVFATRYDRQSWGAITSGAGYLNDAGKTWTVNQWIGYYVFDCQGVAFGPMTSNTAQRLNFANGTPDVSTALYNIRKSNYPNLLESLGPTIEKLNITGQTLTDQGDVLNLTAANGATVREVRGWPPQAAYAASTQEVVVQFAGPQAANPYLSDHMLWLASAFENDLYPTDGAIMVTPYFRDKTVAQLAALLFAACGSAVQATAINVPAYADDVVKYADFGGKNVADALTELAMISNCSLFCTFSGTTTEGDAPKVTFHFQRRDAGLGSALDLSTGNAILERSDSPAWEQYYPSIVVQGANDTRVQKGSARPGGNQLQIQSDYMHTYAWEHQVLDRLWDFYGRRRDLAVITAKAEAIPTATAGVAAVLDDFDRPADDIGDFPGYPDRPAGTGWNNYVGDETYWTIQKPNLDGNLTQVLRHITNNSSSVLNSIYWIDPPYVAQDRDVSFDFLIPSNGNATVQFWIRVSDPSLVNGVKLKIPCQGAAGYHPTLEVWVGGVATEVAVGYDVTMPENDWVTIRAKAFGNIVLVKYWYAGEPEPGAWSLMVTSAPLVASAIVLEAGYEGAPLTMYFDNFRTVGSPGGPGTDLLSRVSLSGTDEWWVMRIARQLRQPAATIDLTLISATGVQYPPDDFATVDTSAIPEPPVVTGVAVSGSNRIVSLDWPFAEEQPLLGFQCTVWRSIDARPETPTIFATIGSSLTVIAGSPPTFEDLVAAIFLTAPGPWYIDYQAVLVDGRTSMLGPAYLFN